MAFLSGCSQEEAGIHPTQATITEAVYGTATVVPKDAYTVFSPVNGIIEQSSLEEGAVVKQGEVLFRISNQRAKLEQQKARQNYAQARESYQGDVAVLKEMEERMSSSRMNLVNDSINYARQSRLWQQNIGSRQAFEATELRYNTARNQLSELKNAYARTRRELANQLALTGTALEISGQNYEEHNVRAQLTGTVYEVLKQVGESVTTQTAVARIGSTDDFLLELQVDEADVARVREGQIVVIVLDAYREQPYEARVSRILPHKDERSQTFTVEAVFTKAPERLYDGLSGEANIIITRREKTLTLPTELIGAGNVVRTAEGERRVITGISDLRSTEIISGIDTSTVVYQAE